MSDTLPPSGPSGAPIGEGEFRSLFAAVSNWGAWGEADERGTLNYLDASRVRAATGLVQSGESVSLSRPLDTETGIGNPEPALHWMTMLGDTDIGSGPLRFAKDFVGADYHNEGHTHLDALCHVEFDGLLYNGRPSESVTSQGAAFNTVEAMRQGIVGRGILLDVPRTRGIPWLEPGEQILTEDLERAEREQHVEVAEGDILLVRTGHSRRCAEAEPWDASRSKAGLHPTVARWLAERRVAVLGSDGNSDAAPSAAEGVAYPIHALALNAMGLPLLDYLQFEDLLDHCERDERWEFLFMASPLRIIGGTGSPLNPLAVL